SVDHLPLIHSIAKATVTPGLYTLSLHDALPISVGSFGGLRRSIGFCAKPGPQTMRCLPTVSRRCSWKSTEPYSSLITTSGRSERSEEHTSELQSRENLVCRLLLEKKKHSSTTIK